MRGSYGFDRKKVWGWVIPDDGSKFVEIILNGRVAGRAPINIFRSDVLVDESEKQIKAGFEFQLQTDLTDSVEVRTQKKRVYLYRAEDTSLAVPPPEMKGNIGIGIVTYNRLEYLQNLINRITKYTTIPYYLVVADDGSNDGTVEWCHSKKIPIVSGANRGVAWNKNRALFHLMEKTDAEIILIVEDDCWPADKYWAQSWGHCTREFHHVNYAHPGISDNSNLPVLSGRGTYKDPYLSSLLAGVCTSSTRQSLEKVGFLDSRFKGYGAEHVEWSIRFNKAYPVNYKNERRTNLFYQIRCGMEEHDAPSYRDEEQIAQNKTIRATLVNEPIHRNPWQTNKEKKIFLQEQKSVNARIFLSNSEVSSVDLSGLMVLLHVPKTAGTSLRIGLESIFDRSAIAYDYGPTEKLTSGFIKENLQNISLVAKTLEQKKCRLLVGHFHIKKYLPILKPEQFIVFFRNPVERVVSDYKHFVRLHDYKKTLMAFASEKQFRNRQSEFLQGVELPQLGFVGISECYEESIERLNEKYNLQVPILVANNNRTNLGESHKITSEERKHIESMNADDIQLYNAAVRLFQKTGKRRLKNTSKSNKKTSNELCSQNIKTYKAIGLIEPLKTRLSRFGFGSDGEKKLHLFLEQAETAIANTQLNKREQQVNLKGTVDNITADFVSGWAFVVGNAEPIEVVCRVNGKVIDTVFADRYRHDLKIKGIHPSGLCGFRFESKDQIITKNAKVEVFVVQYREAPLKISAKAEKFLTRN